MELLRHVVVLLHIVGFAITFGAWTAEAAAKRFRFTRTMDYGLLLSLLTGLALAAPWPAGIELNYPKIGVKLVILVVIGGVLGMAAHVNGAPAIRLRVAVYFGRGALIRGGCHRRLVVSSAPTHPQSTTPGRVPSAAAQRYASRGALIGGEAVQKFDQVAAPSGDRQLPAAACDRRVREWVHRATWLHTRG